MEIRLATDLDQEAWDRYVLKHARGLAYHLYAWKKAIADAYSLGGDYLIAEKENRVCGVFPLIDFKLPFLGRSYVSLPYCDVGGCLADDLVVENALLSEAKALVAKVGAEKLEIRQEVREEASGTKTVASKKVRMILELPNSSDRLLSELKSKLRSQVRKPMRDGLTAKLGSMELVRDFYQVFTENMRDLGSPVHSRQWIESVVRHYAELVKVGVVYTPEGVPAAAGVILLHRNTVSIPWASSLRRYQGYNPNMLLYWSFLAYAADGGYSYFDFGRSTPGEGTYKFKKQWGAKPEALEWIHFDANGYEVATSFSNSSLRKYIEEVWQRMPLSFCNYIGPIIRRYISL